MQDVPQSYIVTPAEFTPSEVAQIAELSPEAQRVWRHRGYLGSSGKGPARFSAKDVAEIMVRLALTKFGLPIRHSTKLSETCAPIVIWIALMDCEGTCEVVGSPAEVETFVRTFDTDDGTCGAELVGLRRKDIKRWLLAFGDGEPDLIDDLPAVFETETEEVGFFGINLSTLGRRLAHRSGRPLLRVTWPTDACLSTRHRLPRRTQP